MPKERNPDTLQATVLRDHRGRIMKGSRRPDAGQRRRIGFRQLLRERFDDTEEGRVRMFRILDQIEQVALGVGGAKPADQIKAAEMLIRLRDGAGAFTDSPDARDEAIDVAGGTRRTYVNAQGLQAIHGQLCEALGCEPDEVSGVLEQLRELAAQRRASEQDGTQ